jgi:hypothetical protein
MSFGYGIRLLMVNDSLYIDSAVAHTGLAFKVLPLHRAMPCAVDYALSARWADKRIMFSGILLWYKSQCLLIGTLRR